MSTNTVCPVERAGSLDSRLRRWIQDPSKIVGPFIKGGMRVLDIGAGPGFFTLDMARMVGSSGEVVAADLQEGMLDKIRKKIQKTDLENRIQLHRTDVESINLKNPFDFILAFYVVHEVPNQMAFFKEIYSLLHPKGQILIVEPPLHVSKKAFEKSLNIAKDIGLQSIGQPKVFLSKTSLLLRG